MSVVKVFPSYGSVVVRKVCVQLIDSPERHQEEWKIALGEMIYEFGLLEARIFLLCSQFMDLDDLKRIPLSKRIDRAIGYSKVQFAERSNKLVALLIELKRLAKFRNAVVHGVLIGSVSMLGVHPSRIMTMGGELGFVTLERTKEVLNQLSNLAERLNEQDRELDGVSLELKGMLTRFHARKRES